MPDVGVRKTESGDRRVTETSLVRVTETFNRAQASLLGTSSLIAAGFGSTLIRDDVTTASFTFIGTTIADSLVPDVIVGDRSTLQAPVSNRKILMPLPVRIFTV